MYRGEHVTSQGLSLGHHSLKMLGSSIIVADKGNKGVIRKVINESENVVCMGVGFHGHGPNQVHVNQSQWAGGTLARGWVGTIVHFA